MPLRACWSPGLPGEALAELWPGLTSGDGQSCTVGTRKDGRSAGGRGVSIIPLTEHHGIWLVCGDFILLFASFYYFTKA